ncbi:hypothetical protein MTO96_022922 [Rhipicephalus appendiculatus]
MRLMRRMTRSQTWNQINISSAASKHPEEVNPVSSKGESVRIPQAEPQQGVGVMTARQAATLVAENKHSDGTRHSTTRRVELRIWRRTGRNSRKRPGQNDPAKTKEREDAFGKGERSRERSTMEGKTKTEQEAVRRVASRRQLGARTHADTQRNTARRLPCTGCVNRRQEKPTWAEKRAATAEVWDALNKLACLRASQCCQEDSRALQRITIRTCMYAPVEGRGSAALRPSAPRILPLPPLPPRKKVGSRKRKREEEGNKTYALLQYTLILTSPYYASV